MADSQFVFRRTDQIGSADAENDRAFLQRCFVDNGDIALMRNLDDPRRLLLGRTGSGKSALLLEFERRASNVIRIEPESLSLNFVSNSNILRFVQSLGVKLDLFFKLLWRHVFVVEIIRRHFPASEESDLSIWVRLERALASSPTNAQKAAIKYLRDWGPSFWEETDHRVKEVTRNFEKKIVAELAPEVKTSIGSASLGKRGRTTTLSEQQELEVRQRSQEVVNHVQIRELTGILELLRDVLESAHTQYSVVIDRLDEGWVDDQLRYLLIRALIETIRDFSKVKRVKIFAALRLDLVDRVFRHTRDAGFQEEKYQALYHDLSWNESQLLQVLDLRVMELIKHRYTKRDVKAADVLPGTIAGIAGPAYLVSRTLGRPRDLILFFNECIKASGGKSVMTADSVKIAEGAYSRARLKALADEWITDYPSLLEFTTILRGAPSVISVRDLSSHRLSELALRLATNLPSYSDELILLATQVATADEELFTLAAALAAVFYRVGLVGVKLTSFESVQWSHEGNRTVSSSEFQPETRLHIHPAFWRTFGIDPSTGEP